MRHRNRTFHAAAGWLTLLLLTALFGPLLTVDAGTTDLFNGNFRPPGTEGHPLGTDRLGRDTLAGLVAGARMAVIVGLGSVGVALAIGLPLGAVAGFFGNDRWRVGRWRLWLSGMVVGGAVVYAWVSLYPYFNIHGSATALLICTLFLAVVVVLVYVVGRWLPAGRRVGVGVDGLVVAGIEVVNSIPGLVLLIALLSVLRRPSIWVVVLVIGGLSWTSVARFVRAELIRIRDLPYLEAARLSGLSQWRILTRHALPNALGPLVVVVSFAIGGAILAETGLSFLGLGVAADQVSWGSMLRQAYGRPDAWWLAVLPGLALTLTVLSLNGLGRRGA